MLKLNNLFQDGAIIQRDKAIPVWGRADAGKRICVEFAGQSVFTLSNDEGFFKVHLGAVPAGGPYSLKVSITDSGESVICNDILVGDVWLASGQSNMQYEIGAKWSTENCSNPKGLNSEQEKEFKESVKNPAKLRFIVVKQNASAIEENNFQGKWMYMTPENAPLCSAAAAWFGKYIQEKTDIPVGLIVSAWGGTVVEAWTSRAGLLNNPVTACLANKTDFINTNPELWTPSANKIAQKIIPPEYADKGNEGVTWGWAKCDFDDNEWKTMTVPGSWINQKISGNGSVWVRKEVTLSDEWLGKDLQLELGGIDKHDITYFNGVEIGRTGKELETEYFAAPRCYEIPAPLVKPGKNIIAVRAYSFIYDGSLNGLGTLYNLVIKGTEKKINLAGKWRARAEKNLGILAGSAARLGPGNPNTPSILFNGMIKPLLPCALKGAIWYQGESNTSNPDASASYFKKLECMVRDWYYTFEQGEFPFIQVQLAYFNRGLEELHNPDSSWAVLRETQRLLSEKVDNIHMATAIDIGDHFDIHPQDKKSVGFRLAQNALRNVYLYDDVLPCGPAYKSYRCENGKIRLFFDFADGMYIKEDLPQSFYIAGPEKIYFPADEVIIDKSSILVSSKEVDFPSSVRYAWADDPVSSLYNSSGMPASSFQTDEL